LKSSGPKRILALDGGGIRGALTLGLASLVNKLDSLRKMEVGENCQNLMTIGEHAAQQDVTPDHFPAVFDLTRGAAS
jgi:hypothetical protein